MLKIKRLLSLFLLVFFSILSLHIEPSFSQSSLNACFSSPGAASECASAGLISPQSAANAVRGSLVNPSPINPFVNAALPSKEAIAILGGVAALVYLRPSDMSSLKTSAPFSSPNYYEGRWYVANSASSARITGDFIGTPIGTGSILQSQHAAKVELDSYGWGYFSYKPVQSQYETRNYAEDYIGSTNNLKFVNVPDVAYSVPVPSPDYSKVLNDAIYAAAAAAAAAAANNTASSDTDRMNAALSAIAAAGLVGAGSPNYPMAQDALNSANAAASALAAAAAAKEQQDKDKALADKLANPSKLPSKAFSDSKNFVSYAVGAFASKFPFDLIYGATDASIPSCPSFSLFYYKWELCFLMPIFLTIRWIVFISISTKVVLEL